MATMNEYLSHINEPAKGIIAHLWEVAKEAIPDYEEGESYGIVALKHKGKPVIAFAAHKTHISMHPFSSGVIERAIELLYGYEVSKGTVKFTADASLSDRLVRQIVQYRLEEIDGVSKS